MCIRDRYRILPDEIKKADMTARWWAIQEDIRSGESDHNALTGSVLETIRSVISKEYPKADQTVMTKSVTERFHEVLGTCPLCGGNVIEGTKGFGCSNYKPPISCRFVIWKTRQSGMFKNAKITAPAVKKLLAGKTVRMRGLIANKMCIRDRAYTHDRVGI